jgi:hypothetical protein
VLAYRQQTRVIKLTDGTGRLEFPSRVTVQVRLSPAAAFGAAEEHSRLVLWSRPAQFIINANSGRSRVLSEPPLGPLDVSCKTGDELWQLVGDVLRLEIGCQDQDELNNVLTSIMFLVPAFLNIILADPPIVELVEIINAESCFRVEHQEMHIDCLTKTPEGIQKSIRSLFNSESLASERLNAAMCYMHTASRLIVAGQSDWEFMPESILNMCKSLQVLFGESMDDVREGLCGLGYPDEAIEGDFIPLMILRSYFDIGHVQLAAPEIGQLQILYSYLMQAENRMKAMLSCATEQLVNGVFRPNDVSEGLRSDRKRKFDQLVRNISRRI